MKKEEEKKAPDAKPEEGKKLRREDAEKQKKEEPEQLDIDMKQGDYRIQIHIMEAKDIKAKGKAGGGGFMARFEGETADPMVEVEIMNQTKITDYKSGQLNPIFNEQLFFEFSNLKTEDLDTAMIKVSLMDHDFIGSNNLIGQFTVDLAYIYKMNKDHELYRMWVPITDTTDETQGINAFLKLSINVLGPGDKPPVHDATKNINDKNDNGMTRLFTPGRVKMSGHIINFNIYRAEHLAPLDLVSNNVDSYFKISFAGTKAESKTIEDDRNPEFNQELSLACKLPCMNGKIKIEVWDDDLAFDKRVGTHYLNFKQIQNKTDGPRWVNLYGPSLTAEGEQADLMTKFGDKGSTYRGRFLYSVTTYDQENPKSGTKDLKFTFPSHPSPSVKEKGYLLKMALYEGIELPEFETVCIHLCCGPFEVKSKVVNNDNSRAIWNEFLPDLIIRGPDNIEDVYDIIIYLAFDQKPGSKVCFKRIKAKDLLDVNGKPWEIDNYLLEEDKSMDKLDDEQFPGIIQARLKLYSKDVEDDFPSDLFKSQDNYIDYLLQIHLFMGRDFPPADETGAADPFVIARCQGKKVKSKVKFETLNPGFYETLELVVSVPPFGDKDYPKTGISLLIYDEDKGIIGTKKDLLGRIWIDLEKKVTQVESPLDGKKRTITTRKEPDWYDLIFDATNSKDGQLLVGYDLIPLSEKEYFPLEKINIAPKVVPGVLSMAIIGLRDIISSISLIPVKKIYCKFDISGDTKEPVITNKHAVIGGACNVLEIIALDIDVPLDLEYSPVLTVYVYDHVMGFLGSRLVGIANIPLHKYCEKVIKSVEQVSSAFSQNTLGAPPIELGDVQIKSKFKGLLGKSNKAPPEPKEETKDINADLFEPRQSDKSLPQLSLKQSKSQFSIQKKEIKEDPEEAEKREKEKKLRMMQDEFKQKVKEEQEKLEQEQQNKLELQSQKSDLVRKRSKIKPKQAAFMQNQEDYDSQPDEKLDEKPEWLVDRNTVEDELEDTLKRPPFDTWKIKRGQTRGKASMFSKTVQSTMETTALFKDIIKIKDKAQQSAEVDKRFAEYIQIKKYTFKLQLFYSIVARLYILKGKSLTPKDSNTSDPFLVIKLGQTTITDKESLRPKTCNPGFFRSYDITASLPGASTLAIECWDDDGFDFPDLIGATKIDLEDRYYNKDWKEKYPGKKPIEERTLFAPKSSAPQGVIQCWLEILDPKEAGSNPRYDISPPPKQEFELRVIIWGTRDCVFKDETTKCNDLFLTGILANRTLETDTHWRCREKGSFNWRWKFPITLPLDPDEDYGKDILTLQMWDRDITDANDMIGEHQILLNDLAGYRMLDKVYKRKKRVTMKKKDTKTDKMLEKFWVCFTHPEFKDKDENYIPQGYAEISIEVLPKGLADEVANGIGREAPNQHPLLPDPTGRFKFDLFSPWKMIKELLGPALARKLCCVVCCSACCFILVYWGFFFIGDIAGALLALAQ